MDTVTEYETKIIRQEDHLKRVTTSMFTNVTAEERDANHLKDFEAILQDTGRTRIKTYQ